MPTPPVLPPGRSPPRASAPTASTCACTPRRAGAERDHAGTLSLLTPLGRPQFHHHVADVAFAVEVDGVLLDEDPASLDVTDSTAVRADRGPDADDVPKTLVVLDHRPRLG